jgi:Flp pilus assembly pilin Flp
MLDQLALRIYLGLRSVIERAQDDEGQTLAEYGLIMAIVGVSVVVLAAVAFRDAIIGAFDNAKTCLGGSC